MVVPFCNSFPVFLFTREVNEPVMVNQAKLFLSDYIIRVAHLFTALLQGIVRIC